MMQHKLFKISGMSGLLALGLAVAAWAAVTLTSFTGPTSVTQGGSYVYQASASDPSALSGDTMKYTFNWGDGTQVSSDTVSISGGMSVSISKTWTAIGTFNAMVMAQNLRTGEISAWSAPLVVTVSANQPPATPTAPTGPTSVRRNTLTVYSVVTTDPDGDALTYTFNWGDGTTTTTVAAPSGQAVTASHAWRARTSPYTVQVKATDSQGASSGWSAPLYVKVK